MGAPMNYHRSRRVRVEPKVINLWLPWQQPPPLSDEENRVRWRLRRQPRSQSGPKSA